MKNETSLNLVPQAIEVQRRGAALMAPATSYTCSRCGVTFRWGWGWHFCPGRRR